MIKLGLGIDEADEEVGDLKRKQIGNSSLAIAVGCPILLLNWYQTEDAADDGEMPPLEGAEEDASRMEEVITNELQNWPKIKYDLLCM